MFCERCGCKLEEGMAFCPKCGASVRKICPKCGAESEKGDLFCESCGARLDGNGTEPAVPVPGKGEEKKGKKEKKPGKKIFGVICAMAVLVAAGAAAFIFLRRQPEPVDMDGRGQEESSAPEEEDEIAQPETKVIIMPDGMPEEEADGEDKADGPAETAAADSEYEADASGDALQSAFMCDLGASGDYSANLDYGSFAFYQSRKDAAFRFSYPVHLYNDVTVSQDAESTAFGTNLENIFFTAADGASSARFQLGSRNQSVSIQESTQQLYQLYEQTLTDFAKIAYSDDSADHGRFVATGYADRSKAVMVYLVVAVYQDSVQIMQINFPSDGNRESEDFLQKSYVVECMYRMCGFGNSSYKPRTYQQYLAGETGEKY